jgi:hypothetical protein
MRSKDKQELTELVRERNKLHNKKSRHPEEFMLDDSARLEELTRRIDAIYNPSKPPSEEDDIERGRKFLVEDHTPEEYEAFAREMQTHEDARNRYTPDYDELLIEWRQLLNDDSPKAKRRCSQLAERLEKMEHQQELFRIKRRYTYEDGYEE